MRCLDVPKAASVIVRTRNKIDTVGAALASIRGQTVPSEVVIVDSGSTDGTLERVRELADIVVEIEPSAYTPGHALNVGAAAASAPVHAALSAHATFPRRDWLELACAHLATDGVAGACGAETLPDRRSPLRTPYVQRRSGWLSTWGFSNTASAWRAEAWGRQAFNATMKACEDLEWAWRVLSDDWRIVVDPALAVHGGHRRREGLVALFRREALEQSELCRHTPAEPLSARAALRGWWGEMPPNSPLPPSIRRLNPLRATEFAGRWVGGLQARASRDRPSAR